MAVRHVEGVGGAAGQRYLAELKPIIATGAEVRGQWMAVLARLKQAREPTALQREAVQAGLDRSQRFRDLRRRLAMLRAPAELAEMHRSVDGWLAAMVGSCDAIVQHPGPLGPAQLDQVRERLHAAARHAEKFNAERRALGGSTVAATLPRFGRGKIAIAAAAVGALLIGAVGYVFLWAPSGSDRAGQSAAGTPTAGVERRVFTQPEILARLRQEITGRSVQFQDVDVRLEPPDRVVVPGRLLGPGGNLIGVTVEVRVGAEDGRPKVTPLRIEASGLAVPQAVTDALAKRSDEANRELAAQVPAAQAVRRVFVENNAVVAEVEGVAPAPSKP